MTTQPPPSRPRRRPFPGSGSGRDRAEAVDASAARQARSVTEALLRTKDVLSRELDRVAALDGTIREDGERLRGAREEHAGMGGTMRGARGVMRRLGRQDVRDAVILRCAIAFYWATVAYVLWSRIKVPFLP
ncbi:hypothetical protein ACHAWF_011366 [Thalassiosira exigua]